MSKTDTVSELDRREIDKFTKHLLYKFVQIVVQSRLGGRSTTRSKQLASSDWFSLSLPDQPEIRCATRAAFGDGQPVGLSEPLCVEIGLRTNENETMTLEYWYLQRTDKTTLPDSNFTAPMTVYNFIGLLLKSLLVVTRSTPAYKLARHQSSDTYRTCYEVCLRKPVTNYESDSFSRQLIGSVPSPFGAVSAYVIYRTKLTACTRQSAAHDLSSTIKDDHFTTSPPWTIGHGKPGMDDGGEYADLDSLPGIQMVPRSGGSADGKSPRQKRPAFGTLDAAPDLTDVVETDPPFASLLQHATGTSPPPSSVAVKPRDQTSPLRGSESAAANVLSGSPNVRQSRESGTSSAGSYRGSPGAKDDFVLVELKAPFAGQEDELGRFYRDCQMAPSLSMFEQTCSLSSMITSITDQLVHFEASADDFNEFVTSLQETD